MPSFTEFCASLECPLANQRWSWSSIASNGRRAVFTVWSDEVKGRKYVLHPVAQRRPGEIPDSVETKLGAIESERIARLALMDPTIEVLGVLCFAKDPHTEHRERKTFDDRTVFVLRIAEEGEMLAAHLVARVDPKTLTNPNWNAE